MNAQMSLEDYKKQVKECLMENQNCSMQESEKLMMSYEKILPEYFALKLTPPAMACAMVMGY